MSLEKIEARDRAAALEKAPSEIEGLRRELEEAANRVDAWLPYIGHPRGPWTDQRVADVATLLYAARQALDTSLRGGLEGGDTSSVADIALTPKRSSTETEGH